MTTKKILEEIESVDVSKLGDGLSFFDHFLIDKSMTPVENLILHSDSKKYYYNYSEKRLRKLVCKLEDIDIHNVEDPSNVIFSCEDLEDEPSIDILANSFTDKVVCFEDHHKVITFDPETKHYECFFVDISKQKSAQFTKENPLKFDDIDLEDEDVLLDTSPKVAEAFKTLCSYLQHNRGELSEIRFTDLGDGIKVDLISSKFWSDDKMNDSASVF